MLLAPLSAGFQSLPLLPTIKLGPSGVDSWLGEFVYVLESLGLSNELSCEAGSFSCCCLNPHRFFQSGALRLYFPALERWVAQSVSLPSCSSRFICTQMWDHSVCSPPPRLVHLAVSPFRPSYRSGCVFFYLLGCWTSTQFDILSVLVVFCF